MMETVNQKLTHRQRQALATRKLIVDTATALFLEHGYVATTIDAIAASAGVAVSTVYAIFTNKRGILGEIRQEWHAESGLRDIYAQALRQPDAAQRLERAAHATRRQWETSTTMRAVYDSAAAVDAEAAAERDQALNGRRTNLGNFVRESYPLLRTSLDPDEAAAVFLALSRSEIFDELVAVAGWSPDAYEVWLARVLKQQFLG